MKEKALKIVRNMSDVEVVRFLEHLGTGLFKGTSRDVIVGGVSPEINSLSEVIRLKSLDADTRKMRLSPQDSAIIARRTLEVIAVDESLAPILVDTWQKYKPDELFVETILAAGFVAGMLLFLATTEIEGEVFGIKFKKGEAKPDVVRAITEPFFSALGKVVGS